MTTPAHDGRFGIPHLRPPGLELRAPFEDRHEPRIPNWFTPWDGDSPLDVGVVMAGLSTTSILPTSCYSAPNAFRLSHPQFTTYSPDYDVDIQTLRVRDLGDISVPILDPIQGLANIQDCLRGVHQLPQRPFVVVIGGDHAVTAPSFRAFCQAHPDLRVGLIHFDAHNDVRVMDHGPTNGTPVRQILESGFNVSGRNLVQVGIHGFMNANYYKRWVEHQGGTIYTGRQVRRQGIDSVVREAYEIAGDGADAIYVTVDIDVLELGYVAGTGAATPEGLHPTDLCEALFFLGQQPKVAIVDFVEHDPAKDVAGITGRTLTSAFLTFSAGLFLRLKDNWRGYEDTPLDEELELADRRPVGQPGGS
jgi:formiminoglutamase